MPELVRVLFAFLVRDLLITLSYRTQFALQLISVSITVSILYFVSRLVGHNAAVDQYGGYLPFVAVGVAVNSYFQTGFNSFANAIRNEQTMGTLEALLMTPARISWIVVASSIWDFFWATLASVTYLVASRLLYGIKFQGNPVLALALLILTTTIFASLGVISASFIMVFKRGDPLGLVIGGVSALFGGVFYPVSQLPSPLQLVSRALPITYGVQALRDVLLKGASLRTVLPQIVVLALFALVGIPFSLFCFKTAVARAKREGSLLQY